MPCQILNCSILRTKRSELNFDWKGGVNNMQNIKTEISGDELIIKINLNEKGINSQTGKSIVLASTHGNQPITLKSDTYFLGVNLYKRR